jgi:Holliday junction DNA helicase RuvB
MRNPFVTPQCNAEDQSYEASIRPQCFEEYIGQQKLKENLRVFIQAAKERGEALDHLLFYGPPGLGKTTLAFIISKEMGVNLSITSGPAIERPGDLVALLTNLQDHDILFIDEIHRLNSVAEEKLYPAMEDYKLDLIIGQGPSARNLLYQLPRFTLIGATTRTGLLTSPLRDRFGFISRLDFYSDPELQTIIEKSAQTLSIEIKPQGALEIARRSRGTPRIANRLLRRVRDFAQVKGNGIIDHKTAVESLNMLEVDEQGFDKLDRSLLLTIIHKFNGGPVGIDTLAAALNEEKDTIEEVCESYLIQAGYLDRTPRGRIATKLCYKYFGLVSDKPEEPGRQGKLW